MTRSIPPIAIEFIASVESCVLRVYDDARPSHILASGDRVMGKLTAGYGHTAVDLVIGMDVTADMARGWLTDGDVPVAAARLARVVNDGTIAMLTDHQYSAMLSFVFNLGADPVWTIWKRLNAKQFDQVPLEMMKFVNQEINGVEVKVQGLVNRRAAEVAFWATQEPGTVIDMPPSSVTREASTPPTPSDPVPAGKSKGLIVGAVGAVAGAGPMVNQVTQAIQPYADHSHYIQKVLAILATVAAACAAIGLFYMYLQKKNARN